MESLYAYALLFCEGYDIWDLYSKELDKLFLDDPENDTYLLLELTTDIKQTIAHIFSITNKKTFDVEIFGRTLMKLISDIYKNSDLQDFAKHMYALWKRLPGFIDEQEPFFILSYADECLSYGDETQCRKLYEEAMNYYG